VQRNPWAFLKRAATAAVLPYSTPKLAHREMSASAAKKDSWAGVRGVVRIGVRGGAGVAAAALKIHLLTIVVITCIMPANLGGLS
jgi:hypothetical protein